MPFAERLEPEDTVLKAKVETLRAKVKEAAANVKSLRATAPGQIEQKLRDSLKTAAEGLPTGVAQAKAQAEEANELRVSAADREAFIENSVSIAKRVKALATTLPEQIALGRDSVKGAQELARLPMSKAEKLVAEGGAGKEKKLAAVGGASKENAGQQPSRRAAGSRVFTSPTQFR